MALGEGDGFWRHLGDMGRTDGDEVSMWCLEVCIEADESNTGRARRESSVKMLTDVIRCHKCDRRRVIR